MSPFDPQLFSRIDDFASELLSGERAARYSPLDWAQWLDDFSTAAATHLKAMNGEPSGRRSAAHRRVATDVAIQAGTGRFFAHKVRSAMLWAIYEKTGDKSALSEALEAYRSARAAWAEMANSAKAVYMADITYGMTPHLRGHWLDRLPAIDDDIADMEKARSQPPPPAAGSDPDRVRAVVREILTPPRRHSIPCRHDAPPHFRPGDPLALELAVDNGAAHAVVLHYRRVNQAEQWRSAEMQPRENRYRAVIAGEYTQSPYGLEYYFELRDAAKAPHLYPGFQPDLSNQPYFLVRQARS